MSQENKKKPQHLEQYNKKQELELERDVCIFRLSRVVWRVRLFYVVDFLIICLHQCSEWQLDCNKKAFPHDSKKGIQNPQHAGKNFSPQIFLHKKASAILASSGVKLRRICHKLHSFLSKWHSFYGGKKSLGQKCCQHTVKCETLSLLVSKSSLQNIKFFLFSISFEILF